MKSKLCVAFYISKAAAIFFSKKLCYGIKTKCFLKLSPNKSLDMGMKAWKYVLPTYFYLLKRESWKFYIR